jgi:4-hydroxy-2-oxoglutarate aldolase
MLLHGIFPPITTPFYPDGKIYFRKLEQNVEQYSRGPIAGIVVQGSTGEAILLSDDERREVLKSARDSAANEKVLIAGTGIESAIETLRLTEYAAELGYDIAMVRTPHYYKGQMAQPANMLAFYRFVCDRSPLPVIIYNFPQATGYDIPAEVVIELAEHPNLIGIKESSGSIEKVQKMVAGTRHIKRSATVTETFAAATGRMLNAAAAASASADGGALVTVGALAGTAAQKPSSTAVTVVGGLKTRQKEIGIPGAGGRGAEAASFAGSRSRGRDSRLCRLRSYRVLRDLCRMERWRHCPGSREAGAHCQGRGADRRRPEHSRREVCDGLQRLLRWNRAVAAAAADRRQERPRWNNCWRGSETRWPAHPSSRRVSCLVRLLSSPGASSALLLPRPPFARPFGLSPAPLPLLALALHLVTRCCATARRDACPADAFRDPPPRSYRCGDR